MDSTALKPETPAGGRVTPLQLIRRFRTNRDGVTSVEFAMVSVPFFGTLFAVLETAFAFFASQTLETALADSARQILTGQAQGNAAITTAQQFRDQIMCNGANTLLPTFIDCSDVKIDVRTVTSFNAADLAKPDYQAMTFQYNPGAPGDIVVVRAVYPLPVYVSLLGTAGTIDLSGRKRILLATATFRNEPY
ncbi:MAG: pilus assembly protein [Methylobacteriaceae bacterium]|nr:pilus assembly protein [Methylobacteriaceae bacterium]